MEMEHPHNPCRLGAAAFPSIEFRSFSRQETAIQDAWGPYETRITVVSSINGIPETTTVVLRKIFGARRELDEVVAPRREGLRFEPGRTSAPRFTPQGSLSIPNRIGSVWHEVNQTPTPPDTYHFVCVRENGSPRQDSVQFVVSGYAAGDSFELLRWKKQSDSLLPTIRCTMNVNKCDTVMWHPGDTVGQFRVQARRKADTVNVTNAAYLDVEAQISQSVYNGKWLKLHYEEANGQGGLTSEQLAESLKVALDSAWDIEVPWLQGTNELGTVTYYGATSRRGKSRASLHRGIRTSCNTDRDE